MKYAEVVSSSLNRTTATAACAIGVLTWFFSAMQCNKQYCYTTDNPVTQVTLAATLAISTVMLATSAPVVKTVTPYAGSIVKKINQAKTFLDGVFAKKKSAPIEANNAVAASAKAESPIAGPEEAAVPRAGSGLFSPKSDSVQANASETSASPLRTPSPSPTNQ